MGASIWMANTACGPAVADLEVYIECDARDCRARSREIWTKEFDGMIWPVTFCSHHSDRAAVALQAQGFHLLESEALTK